MFIYLVHFERKIGKPLSDEQRARFGEAPRKNGYTAHAGHYIGSARDVEERDRTRLTKSREGLALFREAVKQGIGWKVVRLWKSSDRNFEKKLKRRKNAPKLCPFCNPNGWQRHGNYEGIPEVTNV